MPSVLPQSADVYTTEHIHLICVRVLADFMNVAASSFWDKAQLIALRISSVNVSPATI